MALCTIIPLKIRRDRGRQRDAARRKQAACRSNL